MEIETPNTKTALILAAGPLFADKGEEGVSVRTIAGLAEANVASINYHFGNKENLYIATVRYVLDKLHAIHFHKAWADLSAEEKTREGLRDFLIQHIRGAFHNYFQPDNPDWFCQLLYREMIHAPTPSFQMIKETVILPDRQAAAEMFAILKPGFSRWEPEVWMNIWHGQMFFMFNARNSIMDIYGWKDGIDPEYLEQETTDLIRTALTLAGLEY